MSSNSSASLYDNPFDECNRVSTPILFGDIEEFDEFCSLLHNETGVDDDESEWKNLFKDPAMPSNDGNDYALLDLFNPFVMDSDSSSNGKIASNKSTKLAGIRQADVSLDEEYELTKWETDDVAAEHHFGEERERAAVASQDDILVEKMQRCTTKDSELALSDISSISEDDEKLEMFSDDAQYDDIQHTTTVPTLKDIIAQLPPDDPMLLAFKFRRAINKDPTATVPKMKMPKDFERIPIFLAEIFDPAHFWCHIAYSIEVTDINHNFEVFQKELNSTYKQLAKRDLQFTKENLKKGMIVVGFFTDFESWYRVKIIDFDADIEKAQVCCIDYGTRGVLKLKRLKYLFEDFMQYPEYCFRGRLYGVQPPEDFRYFKPTNVEKFIATISGKRFFATLRRYDETEDAYEMSLIRSTDGLDLQSYVISESIGSNIDPQQYDPEICLGPVCYLRPTFQMLETNYPSYVDLYEWENSEVNFNAVVDSNFFHAVTRSNIENNEELKIALQHSEYRKSKRYVYGDRR